MQETKQIYYNDSRTSFYWRKEDGLVMDKVQLIFRATRFYFTKQELYLFKNCIEDRYI